MDLIEIIFTIHIYSHYLAFMLKRYKSARLRQHKVLFISPSQFTIRHTHIYTHTYTHTTYHTYTKIT